MCCGDPNRIDQAEQKSVQKIIVAAILCNDICANNENDQPNEWFSILRDPGNGSQGHA
jgi:hypothetical protein